MGEISFTGDPPYELPIGQRVEAQAIDTIVQVTFYGNVLGKLPAPAPIRVRLAVPIAQALLGQLQSTIPIAVVNGREKRGPS